MEVSRSRVKPEGHGQELFQTACQFADWDHGDLELSSQVVAELWESHTAH